MLTPTYLLQLSIVANTLTVLYGFSKLSGHHMIFTAHPQPLQVRIPFSHRLHKPLHIDPLYYPTKYRGPSIHNYHFCYPRSQSTTNVGFSTPEEIYDDYVKKKMLKDNIFASDSRDEWEECMRRMAALCLIPVFYLPPGYDENYTRTTISSEKALKKLLQRYQRIIIATPSISFEERVATRKRLSRLILGTSVMRLWYHHLYTSKLRQKDDQREVEPLFDINANVGDMPVDRLSSIEYVSREDTVRAMVDLHATYKSHNTTDTLYDANTVCRSVEEISIRRSIPLFLSTMISDQYSVQKADRITCSFNSPGPITLRRNAIKCASDDLLCERLWKDESAKVTRLTSLVIQDDGDILHPSPPVPVGCLHLDPLTDEGKSIRSIWSMSAWKDGWFEVQDAGSQFIVDAMEAKSGETIIDYCAGNGGKTFTLASRMFADATDNPDSVIPSGMDSTHSSRIIAHDIDPNRLKQLSGSLKRIGLSESNITITTKSDPQSLKKYSADAILVDAPCSSSGVLRRRPSHRFQMIEREVRLKFPLLQLEILLDAANMMKAGGRLVYATCSILKCENENVVDAFESSEIFRDFVKWPFCALDTDEKDKRVVSSLSHCRTLLPSTHNCDGFFVARWKRIA